MNVFNTATRGYIERLERLRHLMTSSGLEMIAIVPGPTLQYLCGVSWHLSERPLIAFFPAQGDPAMIIPILEIPKIQDVAPFPIRFFIYNDVEGYVPAFEQACRALALDGLHVGVEGMKMRYAEGALLQKYAPTAHIEIADDAIISLRLIKEAAEVDAMRHAVAVSEAALDATLTEVKIGMTEIEVMNLLLNHMAAFVSGGHAFD